MWVLGFLGVGDASSEGIWVVGRGVEGSEGVHDGAGSGDYARQGKTHCIEVPLYS
jgi:hypothetical protein